MHECKEKHKHKDIQFIPKNEMRQQIEFVSNFLFAIFCEFNKPKELVKNKQI